MNTTSRRTSRGFSLIEVMIAVVVLSFGLLALAALQGSLFRAGAETKARANATAIAQQVVENAKTFAFLSPPPGYVGTTYQSLVTGDLGSHSVGGVEYTVRREVRRFLFNGSSGFCIQASCPGTVNVGYSGARPEFKELIVSVSWSGVDGAKSVQLTDSVSSISPADAAQVIKQPTGASRGPEIWIEPPNQDNPAVVPIAVGEDQSAASSNPVPRRFTKDDSDVAATLFSVLTFTGSPSGTEVLLNRKLDVAGVACRCQAGGRSTVANPAFEPVVWNGKQLAYMEPQPLPVNTRIASFAGVTGSQTGDIKAMCDTCCRDHHESASRSQRPDPHRALTEAEGAEHYSYNDLATPISTGVYSEACQLVRVGGTMRITIDPKQNFLLSVPLNELKTGHEPANFAPRYSQLVVDYLTDVADKLPTGYLAPGAGFPAFDEPKYACGGDPDCTPGPKRYEDILRTSPVILPAPKSRQLVSFGLYMDYINADTKQAYDCALKKSVDDRCDGLRNRNALETLPFYAINVASLGRWSIDVDGREWLSVTSPDYDNKGLLIGDGGVVTAASSSSKCGRVKIEGSRSSSGIAGSRAIDPDDRAFDTNGNPLPNRATDMTAFVNATTVENCKSLVLTQ